MLRFPYAQPRRRHAGAPAAAVLVALAAAAVALDLGAPREALAAHRQNDAAAGVTPLKWLRHSSRQFQRLMYMLAERSARWQGLPGARPSSPAADKWEPDEQREPNDDEEEAPPRDARPQRPWKRGGEARAGFDRSTAVRADVWRPRPPTHCRRAGVPVRGAGWYVVAPGDTLWSIAEAHYGDGRAYRRIYRANWRTVFDPDVIYACHRLYIPRHGAAWPPFDGWRGRRR